MDFLEPSDINNDDDLMEYVRQRLGCPSYVKDTVVFRLRSQEFRALNPHIDYQDLARVIDWCKSTRRRPATLAAVFAFVPQAYQAGILSRAESYRDRQVMTDLYAALRVENDPEWRSLIMNSSGAAQGQVLAAWRQRRSA